MESIEERKQAFIKQAIQIHGDKYDYSKVEYINDKTPVTIICNTCGTEFQETPVQHRRGHGCPKCAIKKKVESCSSSNERFDTFVTSIREIYGDRYEFDEAEYVNSSTKIHIRCKLHGTEIYVAPNNFQKRIMCKECKKELIDEFNEKIQTKEDFSKTLNEKYGEGSYAVIGDFVDAETPIMVVCIKHNNAFSATPYLLLLGLEKCSECAKDNKANSGSSNLEKFIEKSKAVYGENTYDYSKAVYTGSLNKLTLHCNIHDIDVEVVPKYHYRGEDCCPLCKKEKKLKK